MYISLFILDKDVARLVCMALYEFILLNVRKKKIMKIVSGSAGSKVRLIWRNFITLQYTNRGVSVPIVL